MLRNLPLSYIPYRNKGNASLKIVAFILLIIVWPFLLIQLFVSWNHSSKKLTEGEKIDILKFEYEKY